MVWGLIMGGIVEGLFGLTPTEVGQQQQALQAQQAQRYGAQDPMQAIREAQYSVGSSIGNAINQYTGSGTPAELEARKNQQIQTQIDTTTVEGLLNGARLFNQAGNPRMAYQYQQAAQQMKAEQSKAAYEAARTAKETALSDQIPKDKKEIALAKIAQDANEAKKRSEDMNASIVQRSADAKRHDELMAVLQREGYANRMAIAGMNNATKSSIANMPDEPKPMTQAQAFKEKLAFGKSSAGIRSMETELTDAMNAANIIKNHKGLSGATGLSSYIPSYPGSEAKKAETLIDEFKNQVKRTGLTLVRQGGGIGSMTEREWPIVEGMVANLNPAMGKEALQSQVDKVTAKMQSILSNAKASHSEMYGGQTAPSSTSSTSKVITYDKDGNRL